MVEPAGAYVYRVEEKKNIPLETVKAEIESRLGSEQMRGRMEELTNSVKPELNEAYFRSFQAPGPGMIGPAGGPVSSNSGVAPSAPKQVTVTRPAAQKATTTPNSTPKQ